MKSLFVAGTDTGVGKTVVSAGLLKLWTATKPSELVRYWKPIQTGCDDDNDTHTVQTLTGLAAKHFFTSTYAFPLPVSPHLAAREARAEIEAATLLSAFFQNQALCERLLIEGAGGLMVPLAPGFLQIDLIRQLGCDVVLVARDRVGAINHTLLSLEACRTRDINVRGIILNRATQDVGNREAIESFGQIPVLATFPDDTTPSRALERISDSSSLRQKLFL